MAQGVCSFSTVHTTKSIQRPDDLVDFSLELQKTNRLDAARNLVVIARVMLFSISLAQVHSAMGRHQRWPCSVHARAVAPSVTRQTGTCMIVAGIPAACAHDVCKACTHTVTTSQATSSQYSTRPQRVKMQSSGCDCAVIRLTERTLLDGT